MENVAVSPSTVTAGSEHLLFVQGERINKGNKIEADRKTNKRPILHYMPISLVSFPDNKDVSVMMSEMDVNAIAGTLKLYFRELPEPLFTDELYPNFAEGIGV